MAEGARSIIRRIGIGISVATSQQMRAALAAAMHLVGDVAPQCVTAAARLDECVTAAARLDARGTCHQRVARVARVGRVARVRVIAVRSVAVERHCRPLSSFS